MTILEKWKEVPWIKELGRAKSMWILILELRLCLGQFLSGIFTFLLSLYPVPDLDTDPKIEKKYSWNFFFLFLIWLSNDMVTLLEASPIICRWSYETQQQDNIPAVLASRDCIETTYQLNKAIIPVTIRALHGHYISVLRLI
jgi:hypothetical protein